MKLYGMLDSPYVRRVAISLDHYGVAFEHAPLSVFRHFEQFAEVNAVVKAPTLVLDDGTVLLDSNLILDLFEHQAPTDKRQLPQAPQERAQSLRVVGLAMAACDKAVQWVYERELRPPQKQHEPWRARVTTQVHAACKALQEEIIAERGVSAQRLDQASIISTIAWTFIQFMASDVIGADDYPQLAAFAAGFEQLPLFKRYPLE
ncbi:glutathione S-transferase family protein [Pseudomonas sp. 5P_3.1_Bac2]|uniref:glutathione S-transferase family protein n=1 Tax=Pseudomonas sp. 5P_3.1_Bac2 TaxID=2971617 RepID=UPI0021C6D821|nr:glutathione S-transferase [Pseudomonas sp. 5P_3.1_Bac2]MCU1715546.1 glutathione S-transferase [Pseudomonas sp. 5P_3.1_Bac2]